MYFEVLFNFFLSNKSKQDKNFRGKNIKMNGKWIKFLEWTCLRGVSSMSSSSSCSLSQSHGAFRFLFLHSHPCLRLLIAPSAASSGPWQEDWNLLLRFPISTHINQFVKHHGENTTCYKSAFSSLLLLNHHHQVGTLFLTFLGCVLFCMQYSVLVLEGHSKFFKTFNTKSWTDYSWSLKETVRKNPATVLFLSM